MSEYTELAEALEGIWELGGRPDDELKAEVLAALRSAAALETQIAGVRKTTLEECAAIADRWFGYGKPHATGKKLREMAEQEKSK